MNSITKKLAAASALFFATAPGAWADIVHADDVIIQGSLCVGFDCVNGENFGFDTIRMKENNLRLHFDDTSNSASFPGNDWRIVANDSTNGGANYLAFEDSTAGRQVFRVDAGAPFNSLRVDAQGDVGFGTSAPVLELHVADGDSPSLRLEQNGSAGFTPQTWDIAGNETNFFIRDVTGGSTLPFKIRPGSANDLIVLQGGATDRVDIGGNNLSASLSVLPGNGNVGISTNTPADRLTVSSAAGVTDLRLESTDTGGAAWRLRANAINNTFTIQDGESLSSTFKIKENAGNNRFVIDSSGAVGINTANPNAAAALDVNGPVFLRGGVLHADYVFDPDYQLESIEEHAEFMWNKRHLPAVPKREVDQSGQELISLGADRRGIVEELEKAHIYIEQLHQGLRDKDARLELFAERLVRLEERLAVPDQ